MCAFVHSQRSNVQGSAATSVTPLKHEKLLIFHSYTRLETNTELTII